jgi:hypothetical protein
VKYALPFPRNGFGIDQCTACAGILEFDGVSLRSRKSSAFCGSRVGRFVAVRQIPKMAAIVPNGFVELEQIPARLHGPYPAADHAAFAMD